MESIYEDMYFQAIKEQVSLNDKIMEFREKLPEDLGKEYDALFNISKPSEKIAKFAESSVLDPKFKESLLKMAYFGMLMDIAWFRGSKELKTATIIETGEMFTFEQLEEMFKKDKYGTS